jgi:hypothetical protein
LPAFWSKLERYWLRNWVQKFMHWLLKKWLITCPAHYVGRGLTALCKSVAVPWR